MFAKQNTLAKTDPELFAELGMDAFLQSHVK